MIAGLRPYKAPSTRQAKVSADSTAPVTLAARQPSVLYGPRYSADIDFGQLTAPVLLTACQPSPHRTPATQQQVDSSKPTVSVAHVSRQLSACSATFSFSRTHGSCDPRCSSSLGPKRPQLLGSHRLRPTQSPLCPALLVSLPPYTDSVFRYPSASADPTAPVAPYLHQPSAFTALVV